MTNIIGITGASGMLGKHLIHILSKKKIKIISTSRKRVYFKNKRFQWKKLDLMKLKNEKPLKKIFENINTVVHLGALVPLGSHQNRDKIKKTNFESTVIMAKWAIKNDIHFIYISGAIIYDTQNNKKIKEDSLIKKNFLKDYYGQSKRICDVFLQKKIKLKKKITILRPTSIYGCGLNKNKIMMKLIRLTKLNKPIKLYEPFEKINLIHANDVVNAIYKSIIKKKFKIFNIGSDKLYSIIDLSKILININKSKSRLKIIKDMNKKVVLNKYNISSNKAKNNLNWKNKIGIKNGLKLVIEKKYE